MPKNLYKSLIRIGKKSIHPYRIRPYPYYLKIRSVLTCKRKLMTTSQNWLSFCKLVKRKSWNIHWASCWSALPDRLPIVVENLPFVVMNWLTLIHQQISNSTRGPMIDSKYVITLPMTLYYLLYTHCSSWLLTILLLLPHMLPVEELSVILRENRAV